MPIYQDLSQFLTANGVDGSAARTVASRIQRKAQRNAGLNTEEITIVYEFIQRVPHNNYETMQLQRLVGQTPVQPTEKGASSLSQKVSPVGVASWKMARSRLLGGKVSPVPIKQDFKWDFSSTTPSTSSDANDKPLSPAMIRQLAHRIALS